jgi:hypothetical protein
MYESPYHAVHLQNGYFAASTLVVTHQRAQFNKMKSKQQIKNQNTNQRQQTHPHRRRRACNRPASPAGKPTFRQEKISIADNSFLSPNPASLAGKKPEKKNYKTEKINKTKKKNKTQTPNHF